MAIHVGNRVKQLIEGQKDLPKRRVAEKLGMTEVNLYKILNKEDLSTELLKKIAEVLSVPVGWFFQEAEPQNVAMVEDAPVAYGNVSQRLALCEREVEHLRAQLKDKERIIALLERKN